MRELVLTRKLESPQGTFDSLNGAGLFLHTAELPWRENRAGLSRIPAGSYRGRAWSSAKFPHCYEILGVPGREPFRLEINEAFSARTRPARRKQAAITRWPG